MRVTADTNIYISALNYGGLPARFLDLAASGSFILAMSDAILAEIAETLRRKFLWPQSRIETAIATISDIAARVVPTAVLDVVRADPEDNRILECAQAARSDYIVTGDKDLLRLGQHDGTPIMTVSQFLREFRLI